LRRLGLVAVIVILGFGLGVLEDGGVVLRGGVGWRRGVGGGVVLWVEGLAGVKRVDTIKERQTPFAPIWRTGVATECDPSLDGASQVTRIFFSWIADLSTPSHYTD
jgi:hypothetical protein